MDNVECPFCGQVISTTGAHPSNLSDCPLDGYAFGIAKWNMRPPKKEPGCTPKPAVTSEVEWLRRLVEKLTLEDPCRTYETTTFFPSNIATSIDEK